MAYALLCAIDRADETARPLPPLVAEAVAAIRQNYMALYGVEELSEQLGVTKSHLVRVFKQEIGVPPGKYMTNVRIEAVKSLLLTDEYNLEMIAGLTGFSGANYLCRVFKREVGLSPAAWRAAAAPLPASPSCRREVRKCMYKRGASPLGGRHTKQMPDTAYHRIGHSCVYRFISRSYIHPGCGSASSSCGRTSPRCRTAPPSPARAWPWRGRTSTRQCRRGGAGR